MYKVLDENLETLKANIGKLNKRARKLHAQEILLDIGAHVLEKCEDDTWIGYYPVEVLGEAPVINGWRFVATLEHTDDGTLVRSVPGVLVDLSAYYDVKPVCNYCKRDWLKRNDTFLVQQISTGELKQVGRNCLADFLGHTSPEVYALQAELLSLADEAARGGEIGSGSGVPYYDLHAYLKWVAATIRTCGWVSRGKAREEGIGATADIAMAEWELQQKGATAKRHVYPEQKDGALADNALEWAAALDNPTSDYLHNVWVVAKGYAVTHRQMGIAASIISAYQRTKDDESAPSVWVGEIGKRYTTEVEVIRLSYVPGYTGGSTTVVAMRDLNGNRLTWFATNNPELQEGMRYSMTARVKKHAMFRGQQQTLFSHAVLEEVNRCE